MWNVSTGAVFTPISDNGNRDPFTTDAMVGRSMPFSRKNATNAPIM